MNIRFAPVQNISLQPLMQQSELVNIRLLSSSSVTEGWEGMTPCPSTASSLL